jgi:hypothetical protein
MNELLSGVIGLLIGVVMAAWILIYASDLDGVRDRGTRNALQTLRPCTKTDTQEITRQLPKDRPVTENWVCAYGEWTKVGEVRK